jgi:hypothetical protein
VVEQSDTTGIDRLHSLRILKGFKTRPSLRCQFVVVIGGRSAIPPGSIEVVDVHTSGVAALNHGLIADVLPGWQSRRDYPLFTDKTSFTTFADNGQSVNSLTQPRFHVEHCTL